MVGRSLLLCFIMMEMGTLLLLLISFWSFYQLFIFLLLIDLMMLFGSIFVLVAILLGCKVSSTVGLTWFWVRNRKKKINSGRIRLKIGLVRMMRVCC